jgi:hypothetical protein
MDSRRQQVSEDPETAQRRKESIAEATAPDL